ncbi:MAG TPA: 23S rRNA pseudouridine(1911/1915/1917) synthase RluD [Nevskiaceae bacterium]|nr:23S rRNA pseudouridine(1911/1915/1917) synthase RluD [Nevskiaceae bacterium]
MRAEVTGDLDGARLDVAAARLFADYSRARLKLWLEAGRLQVNGAVVQRARHAVAMGDALSLDVDADSGEGSPAAQAIPIDVVYADEAIAVLNKPAGLVVHPGAGIADGTLMNALLARFPQTAQVPRAGIVHRLDKDTTGLLVVALCLPAHTHLVAALARREIHRQYDTIVVGTLVAGSTIDAPIGRDPRHRTRMAVVAGGRRAVTHFTVAQRFARHTRLDVRLETGRTHQIRVHLANLHHPVVGDAVYGARRLSGVAVADQFPRQALHACRLMLKHPLNGEILDFRCPPPADFQALVAALEAADG